MTQQQSEIEKKEVTELELFGNKKSIDSELEVRKAINALTFSIIYSIGYALLFYISQH